MSTIMNSRRRVLWVLIPILLIGVALRLEFIRIYGLEPDELFTLGIAQNSAGYLMRNFLNTRIDIHSSLYSLGLHFWIKPAGISPIALRFPNVIGDVIAGAVMIAAARRLTGSRGALVVGALWAVNPLAISGVSLARGHSLMGSFAIIAWVCMMWAITRMDLARRQRGLLWVIFGICALAAGYLHAVGIFAMAGLLAAGGLVGLFRRRLDAIAAVILVGLGYLPYLILLVSQQNVRVVETRAPMLLPEIISFVAALLTSNQQYWSMWVLWALLLVVVIALVFAWRSSHRAWTAAVWITLGVYVACVVYQALGTSLFKARYFVFLAPFAVLGVGLGLMRVPSRLGRMAGLAILVMAAGLGLVEAHHPSVRDDFVAVAEFLESHAGAGDLVLVTTDYAEPVVDYYYDGPARVQGVAPWKNLSADEQQAVLDQAAGYETVWLVLHANLLADPEDALNGWFGERYPLRTEIYPTGASVYGYDVQPKFADLPPDVTPMDVIYDGKLALRGIQLYADSVLAADRRLHPPSGWIHVTLYWEVLVPGLAFEPRLRIENDLLEIWGVNILRGTETYLRYPTSTWQGGEIWRTDQDINLNPDAPRGSQKIVLQVFAADQPSAMVISEGSNAGFDWIVLDTIMVRRP